MSLAFLPPHLLLHIASYASFNSLIALSFVNKSFQGVVLYPHLAQNELVPRARLVRRKAKLYEKDTLPTEKESRGKSRKESDRPSKPSSKSTRRSANAARSSTSNVSNPSNARNPSNLSQHHQQVKVKLPHLGLYPKDKAFVDESIQEEDSDLEENAGIPTVLAEHQPKMPPYPRLPQSVRKREGPRSKASSNGGRSNLKRLSGRESISGASTEAQEQIVPPLSRKELPFTAISESLEEEEGYTLLSSPITPLRPVKPRNYKNVSEDKSSIPPLPTPKLRRAPNSAREMRIIGFEHVSNEQDVNKPPAAREEKRYKRVYSTSDVNSKQTHTPNTARTPRSNIRSQKDISTLHAKIPRSSNGMPPTYKITKLPNRMVTHTPSPFREVVYSYLKNWTGCQQLNETFEEERSRGLEWRLAVLYLVDRFIISKSSDDMYGSEKLKIRWEDDSLLSRSVHPSIEERSKKWIGVYGDHFIVQLTNMWHYAISLSQRGYNTGALDKYYKCIRITQKQWKSTWNRLQLQKYHERLAYLNQGVSTCLWSILQRENRKKDDLDFNMVAFKERQREFEEALSSMIRYFTLLYEDPFLKNLKETYRIILTGANVRFAQYYLDFADDEAKSSQAWKNGLNLSMESRLDLVLYQVFLRMQIAQTYTHEPSKIHRASSLFREILSDFSQDLDPQWLNHLIMCICITEAMTRATVDLDAFKDAEKWNYMCIDLLKYCHRLYKSINRKFRTSWQKDLIDSLIDAMREVSLSNFDHAVGLQFTAKSHEYNFGSDIKWVQKSLRYLRKRVKVAMKCNMRLITDEELERLAARREKSKVIS